MQRAQRSRPIGRVDLLWRDSHPTQFVARQDLADDQTQITRCVLYLRCQLLPVEQAPRILQAVAEQVMCKVQQLGGTELLSQKLYPSFIELMRFVKNNRLHRWQQLGQA